MDDNSQEVQYRILQEAHETAVQLNAAEASQPVTIVQVSRDGDSPEESLPPTMVASSGQQTVIITSPVSVNQAATTSAVFPTDVNRSPVMVIPPSASNTQVVSPSGHVVTVRSSDISSASLSSGPGSASSQLVFTQEEVGDGMPVNQVQVEVDAVPEGMLCLVCSDRGML